MLRELRNVRQIPGDRFRRWFTDENLEVVVWYEESGTIYGFQLCYDPRSQPRALTWTPKHGFSHAEIDDGDDKPTSNRTPILRSNADYNAAQLREAFLTSADELPAPEKAFIVSKLAESSAPG